MSMRSFVACCSVFLMAWLAWAYVHTPVARGGADPVTAGVDKVASADEQEMEELTVSVSPSEVTPD